MPLAQVQARAQDPWSPLFAHAVAGMRRSKLSAWKWIVSAVVAIIGIVLSIFTGGTSGIAAVALIGGVVNGLIVGLELYLALELPFMINAFYVFIGEFIVLIIGAFLFKCLEKNKTLMDKYILE